MGLAVIGGGCGSSGNPPSKAERGKEALSNARMIRVGSAGFIRLDRSLFDREQEKALAEIVGGHWVSNGVLIPFSSVVGLCRAELFSRGGCRAFFKR